MNLMQMHTQIMRSYKKIAFMAEDIRPFMVATIIQLCGDSLVTFDLMLVDAVPVRGGVDRSVSGEDRAKVREDRVAAHAQGDQAETSLDPEQGRGVHLDRQPAPIANLNKRDNLLPVLRQGPLHVPDLLDP